MYDQAYLVSDDVSNAFGLGYQAIKDGVINVAKCTGVTRGAGQTTTVRQATHAAIQNAINIAEANGLWLWFPAGIYEINGVGLKFGFGANPIYAIGAGRYGARIIQYNTNVPCATIGDPSPASIFVYGYTAKGFSFEYGVSQTGNTNANVLVIGALSQCLLEDINAGSSNSAFAGYRGIYQNASSGEFSNTYRQFQVQFGQLNLVGWQATGSGSLWEDWYMRNGALNAPGVLSGYAWDFITGGGPGTMLRMNIEAVKVQNVFHTETCRNLILIDTHLETVTLTGANPAVFFTSYSTLDVQNFWIDFRLVTTDGASGYGRMFTQFGGDEIKVSDLHLLSQSTDSGAMDLNFVIFDGTTSSPDTPPNLQLQSLYVDDFNGGGMATRVFLCNELAIANFKSPKSVSSFRYNGVLSYRVGAVIFPTAAITIYGGDIEPEVVLPLTGTFNVTFSNSWYPGSTAKPHTGAKFRVRRAAGTASGAILVKDNSGTTLYTTAGGGEYYGEFNGTAWVAVA